VRVATEETGRASAELLVAAEKLVSQCGAAWLVGGELPE
jgi:hypothetical protein